MDGKHRQEVTEMNLQALPYLNTPTTYAVGVEVGDSCEQRRIHLFLSKRSLPFRQLGSGGYQT